MMTIVELQREIGEWSSRNFPGSPAIYPLAGLVEEVGELAHSLLKSAQGIRGTAEQHLAKAADAIGDATIYLLDYTNKEGLEFTGGLTLHAFQEESRKLGDSDSSPISAVLIIASLVGRLIEDPSDNIYLVMAGLAETSQMLGLDYQQIVEEKWGQVSARNWAANRLNGHAERN